METDSPCLLSSCVYSACVSLSALPNMRGHRNAYGHPKLSGLVQDYSRLEPTVSILLPCFNKKGRMCTTPSEPFLSVTIRRTNLKLSPPMTAPVMTARSDLGKSGSGFSRPRRSPAKFQDIGEIAHPDRRFSLVHLRHHSCDRFRLHFREGHDSELVSCFADPKMGVVGGTVGVRNPDANSLTQVQTRLLPRLRSVEDLRELDQVGDLRGRLPHGDPAPVLRTDREPKILRPETRSE